MSENAKKESMKMDIQQGMKEVSAAMRKIRSDIADIQEKYAKDQKKTLETN